MSEGLDPFQDPLALENVDRQIRINELREHLAERGMQDFQTAPSEIACPPETEEAFLSSVMAYETAPLGTLLDRLKRAGVALPAPDTLDDAAIHAKIWEMVAQVAKWSIYLERTDHLSDRELYHELWNDSLREVHPIFPPGSGWNQHFDMLGGCSDEDLQNSLRYYDDEETRQRWAHDFPNDTIPPHVDPPYDRDRLLPKAPPPEPFSGAECEDFDDEGCGDGARDDDDEGEAWKSPDRSS